VLCQANISNSGLLKAASSASVEHNGAIQELLKLVRNLQSQNGLDGIPSISPTIELETSSLSGRTAVEEACDQEMADRNFELEAYSGPEAWMSKFR
jgi:hypothetical protein